MTSSEDYLALIKRRISSQEKPKDVAKMIEILAKERIAAEVIFGVKKDENVDKHYDFSAKVMCIIFDMFKSTEYRSSISQIRLQFKGIAASPVKAGQFRKSLSERLLQENDEREIYELFRREGINSLFGTRGSLLA